MNGGYEATVTPLTQTIQLYAQRLRKERLVYSALLCQNVLLLTGLIWCLSVAEDDRFTLLHLSRNLLVLL